MGEASNIPHEEGEQENDEPGHTPSRLEKAKMVLEMVWIIARLVGM